MPSQPDTRRTLVLAGGQPEATPHAGDYVRVLRRRAWVVAATAAAVVAVGLLYVWTASPLYEASARVLLARESPAATLTDTGGATEQGDPERFVQTQAQVARSESLAARVLAATGTEGRSAADVADATEVLPIAGADMLEIRVLDRDAVHATRLADEYAEQFAAMQRRLDRKALEAALRKIRTSELAAAADGDPALLDALEDKRRELETAMPLDTGKAAALRSDEAPAKVRPRPARDALVALAAGLLLGTILAFVTEALDRRTTSLRELSARLGLPVLGRVGRRRRLADPPSDDLRANFDRALAAAGCGDGAVIAVTSASRRDDRQAALAGLALALASAGRRVTSVQLDRTRPLRHRLARLTRRVDLIPHDLAPRDRAALDALRARSDIVLLDAPPLLGRGEDRSVARHADAHILVVRVDLPERRLERLRAKLARGGPVVIGLIATRATRGFEPEARLATVTARAGAAMSHARRQPMDVG